MGVAAKVGEKTSDRCVPRVSAGSRYRKATVRARGECLFFATSFSVFLVRSLDAVADRPNARPQNTPNEKHGHRYAEIGSTNDQETRVWLYAMPSADREPALRGHPTLTLSSLRKVFEVLSKHSG